MRLLGLFLVVNWLLLLSKLCFVVRSELSLAALLVAVAVVVVEVVLVLTTMGVRWLLPLMPASAPIKCRLCARKLTLVDHQHGVNPTVV